MEAGTRKRTARWTDRSDTKHARGAKLHDKVATVLECIICLEMMTPPLRQCFSGHMICNSCLERLDKCPTCRCSLDKTVRNRGLEELLSDTIIKCCYASHGCTKTMAFSALESHRRMCPFQPFGCPQTESCSWKGGDFADLIHHLVQKHAADLVDLDAENPVFVERYGNSDGIRHARWDPTLLRLVNADFNGVFMLNFLQQMNGSFAACIRGLVRAKDLDAIPDSSRREDFPRHMVAELSIRRGFRKISWRGPVGSFRHSVDRLVDCGDCLAIPMNLALFFSDNDCLGSESIHNLSLEVHVSLQFVYDEQAWSESLPFRATGSV